MSQISDSHVDAVLTNFSVQLPVEQGFVGLLCWPSIKVKKESDKYYKFYREELKDRDVRRADGAESAELKFAHTTDDYTCDEKALHGRLTDRVKNNSDSELQLEMRTVAKVHTSLMLQQERRIQALVQTAGTWSGSTTISTKWDNASGDPQADVHAAKQAFFLQCGRFANVAVINELVADALIRWLRTKPGGINLPEWRSLDKGAVVVGGEDKRLAGLFGISRWLVGMAIRDSAATNTTTESNARVWGSHCTLLYVNPRPSLNSVSAGYSFHCRNQIVKKWREEKINTTFYEESHLDVEKTVSTVCGYHMASCLT